VAMGQREKRRGAVKKKKRMNGVWSLAKTVGDKVKKKNLFCRGTRGGGSVKKDCRTVPTEKNGDYMGVGEKAEGEEGCRG